LDPLIKSQLLYQLSYAPGSRPRPSRESARRVAGDCRTVQRSDASGDREKKEPPGGDPAAPSASAIVSGGWECDRRRYLD
jgi:hypothetical protein